MVFGRRCVACGSTDFKEVFTATWTIFVCQKCGYQFSEQETARIPRTPRKKTLRERALDYWKNRPV